MPPNEAARRLRTLGLARQDDEDQAHHSDAEQQPAGAFPGGVRLAALVTIRKPAKPIPKKTSPTRRIRNEPAIPAARAHRGRYQKALGLPADSVNKCGKSASLN